jgi:CRP-like cAMP-binding protein
MSHSVSYPTGNKLLAALPPEEYERLLPDFELVHLASQQTLYTFDLPIQYAYFPLSGVVALLRESGSKSVEAATVGNEGMLGVPLILGADRSPTKTVVQIPGEALCMPVDVFKAKIHKDSPLHHLLLRYTLTLINQISQNVVCNQLHSLEERCCRWLLMAHDRLESNEIPLTQSTLAFNLCVRRAGVSAVATTLQRAGIIRYHRGKITILDPGSLEAACCPCYQINKQEFERLRNYRLDACQ